MIRNKDKTINTPHTHLLPGSASLLLSWLFSFLLLSSTEGWAMEVLISPYNFAASFFLLFFFASRWIFPIGTSSSGTVCSSGGSMGCSSWPKTFSSMSSQWTAALRHLHLPQCSVFQRMAAVLISAPLQSWPQAAVVPGALFLPLSSVTLVSAGLFLPHFSHSFLMQLLCSGFCLFLEYVIPEVPPSITDGLRFGQRWVCFGAGWNWRLLGACGVLWQGPPLQPPSHQTNIAVPCPARGDQKGESVCLPGGSWGGTAWSHFWSPRIPLVPLRQTRKAVVGDYGNEGQVSEFCNEISEKLRNYWKKFCWVHQLYSSDRLEGVCLGSADCQWWRLALPQGTNSSCWPWLEATTREKTHSVENQLRLTICCSTWMTPTAEDAWMWSSFPLWQGFETLGYFLDQIVLCLNKMPIWKDPAGTGIIWEDLL